jgi:hypothetical protein
LSEGPGQKISKGKLPDKYRNKRKSLKAAGALPQRMNQNFNVDQTTGCDIYIPKPNWFTYDFSLVLTWFSHALGCHTFLVIWT